LESIMFGIGRFFLFDIDRFSSTWESLSFPV
jgi:hypothetical protein